MNVPAIYLALGANLGDRAENLGRALRALAPAIGVECVSPCYETAPAYVLDQPRFLNVVCRATTTLDPLGVLRCLKTIEAAIGRTAGLRFGPRLIDLDLLLYGELLLDTPELTVPHPRIAERGFVLVPFADIAPDLIHPLLGVSIAALRDRLPDAREGMRRAEEIVL
ncbi:MAG: 2-amino-4-hydroxy-6-hydroxymethyldihydropteridine diphosphokinase [Oscillochloris sp.]|nr:2-amino-4-hydroxy-6-hydroxymethyldihydropteridine diphosphokinase [Oscillochloris sp.]